MVKKLLQITDALQAGNKQADSGAVVRPAEDDARSGSLEM